MIDCIVVELERTPIEIPIKYRTVYYVKIFDYVVSRVSCICALCTHVYIVYGCTYSQLKRLRNVKLHPVKPVVCTFQLRKSKTNKTLPIGTTIATTTTTTVPFCLLADQDLSLLQGPD